MASWRFQSVFWTRCELAFGVLLVAVITAALCEAPKAQQARSKRHLSEAEAIAAYLDEADVDLAVPDSNAERGYYGYYLTDGKRSRRPTSWGRVTPEPPSGETEKKHKAGLVWNEILEQYDVSSRFPSESPSSQLQATSFASTTPPSALPRDGQSSGTQIKQSQASGGIASSSAQSSTSLNVSSESRGRRRGREGEREGGELPDAGVEHFVRVSRQLAGNGMFVHRSRQYDVPQIGEFQFHVLFSWFTSLQNLKQNLI